jgi:hypothetical protein
VVELIDAFLAEHAARVSTARIEKDFFITEVFSIFTEPVVYQGNEAKFMLCGGTAVFQSAPVYRTSFRGRRSAGGYMPELPSTKSLTRFAETHSS